MASNNPRPKLMADMTALCKNLEKKVSDLELETRAILNCNRAGGNGAADEWLQEVKGLHSEIDITLSTVVEERSNMESFLGEMNSELRRVMAETTRMQNFMAQYGYKAEELDIEAMLDWEEAIEEEPVPDVKPVPALYEEELKLLSDIAPPNASEFEETTDRLHFDIAPKSPEIIKKEGESSKKTSVVDSPSIFDIGLSKYGMSLVLGKDLAKSVTKQQAAASRSPEMIPNIAISKPRTESPRSPAIPNLTSILEESKYDSSPVLKLNTIAFPRNIDDSAVDITPGMKVEEHQSPIFLKFYLLGLPARKKPLSGRRAVIEDVTPELPTLASNIARENLKPQAGAAFSSLGDSPEMPEFTSNFVKALAIGGKERAQLKPSRPTPEFPELSILKSDVQNVTQTKTPDSPELTTVYKSMRNFKL